MSGWIEIAGPRLATLRRTPLRATFIERPHRFAARCTLRDGREVLAHLPNPGRLTGVLAPRCQLLLDGPYPPARALPYTMVAARAGGSGFITRSRGLLQSSHAGCETGPCVWVGTNTIYANRVFPALVSGGLFPELADRTGFATSAPRPDRAAKTRQETPTAVIESEVAHGRSRFDFRIGGIMVEVKSVTLAKGHAGAFPDAVSVRAARHCDELAALCGAGNPTALVFVAQRGDVESVAPEDGIDPVFGAALRRAAAAGVLVLACALDVAPAGAARARRVPVCLQGSPR
jgi:sugar fermentation stimulation protein A